MKKIIVSLMLITILLGGITLAIEEELEIEDEDDDDEISNGQMTRGTSLADMENQPQNAKCWREFPRFQPGFDKGVFLWQGDCNGFQFISWSGDLRLIENRDEEPSKIKATITTDGEFLNVGTKAFEEGDIMKWDENTIEIEATVGTHFDGIYFFSTGETIKLDFEIDGEHQEELIYIGKDYQNPESIPFVLKNKEFDEPKIICKENETFDGDYCKVVGEPAQAKRNRPELDSNAKGFSVKNAGDFIKNLFRRRQKIQGIENFEILEDIDPNL